MRRIKSKFIKLIISYLQKNGFVVATKGKKSKQNIKTIFGTLSKREMEVLELIATEGLKAKQIAEKLNISKYTVNNHIVSIYAKTGCNSKSQLLVFVHKNGLFE